MDVSLCIGDTRVMPSDGLPAEGLIATSSGLSIQTCAVRFSDKHGLSTAKTAPGELPPETVVHVVHVAG
jgi:hypothetical protein